MIQVYGIEPERLETILAELGQPSYRSKQFLNWIYREFVSDIGQMTNLPKGLRSILSDYLATSLPKVLAQKESSDGTIKYSLSMNDNKVIEMVLIPTERKNTLCISSQAGCARDCLFCETGKHGLKRNLDTHEIVGQIVMAARQIKPMHISNLVFMGMGEPMDNLESVLKTLRIIQSDKSISISPRKTTISTCGVIPGIIQLADSGIKTKLAVSLNSAIPEKRDLLMPINAIYPLNELKKALMYFRSKTSYRITFEYIMIPDVNMGVDDLKALKKYVTDISCKINLIPWNPIHNASFRAPTDDEMTRFVELARSIKQAVTIRKSRGSEIGGACGQLAYNT